MYTFSKFSWRWISEAMLENSSSLLVIVIIYYQQKYLIYF